MILHNRLAINWYLIICLMFSVVICACKQPAKTSSKKVDTTTKAQSTPAINTKAETVTTDTISKDDCPRGIAEPVIKKDIFPDARFTLQPDQRTGMETLTLTSGDRLILKQSGCEYYILTFRFETSRFTADTTNVGYWSNVALLLLRETSKGLDVPLDVEKALNMLSARLEKDKSGTGSKLELNEEIDFGGPDPRQYLTIERITKLANQQYAIELSLSYGPI
jgi:hypothetical protein